MLIPYHRYPYTGNSDHDADCVLNVQTTSHITPSPSSVSPTQKNTTTTLDTTTSSTEDTEEHTTPTSTTTILQSTDSGEPSANTETSKQTTMDIHTTSRPTPQHSKDSTGTTQSTTKTMSNVHFTTGTDATKLAAKNSQTYKVAPEPTPSPHLTTIPPGEV